MIKKLLSILLVSLLGCFLFSCNQAPAEWLVKVNDNSLTKKDLEVALSNLSLDLQREIPKEQQPNFVLNEIVKNEIFYQEALKSNYLQNDDYRKIMARLADQYEFQKKQSLVNIFLRDKIDSQITLTNEEVVEAYNQNKALFDAYTERSFSYILVKTKQEADDIFKSLKKGKNFESVAKSKSIHNSAQNNGLIGFIRQGSMIPELDKPAFSLKKPGFYTRPIQTEAGFNILKYNDSRNVPARSFDQVKQLIQNDIFIKKQSKLTEELLTEIKDAYTIEENLPKEQPANTEAAPESTKKPN